MKLDLEKFAIARNRFSAAERSMGYLLDHIRDELKSRMSLSRRDCESLLVMDFDAGTFEFPAVSEVRYLSLFDLNFDAECLSLPCTDGRFDHVILNLQGSWIPLPGYLSQIKRVLKEGGEFYFAAFGPDTLTEIDRAWRSVDSFPHVHAFMDMHHLGDALVAAGFEKPIVDAQWTEVAYPDGQHILADLKSEGFVNINSDRRKTLTGKNRFNRFASGLRELRSGGDKIGITFEIVFGFAKKPTPRNADGKILVAPPGSR